MSKKGLFFNILVDERVPNYVIADESKLKQVLINLLSNAYKFTSNGRVLVQVNVGQLTSDIAQLLFEVKDTGKGIEAESIKYLFDPFWQNNDGKSLGGTGLGLPICKSIVELMNGEIHAESQYEQGSIFKFYVMVKPLEKFDVAIESDVSKMFLASHCMPFRVLVVDDQQENRSVLSELLSSVGFDVLEKSNGKEAIDACLSWRPQVVLIDIRMPVLDGFEAIRSIRKMIEKDEVYIIGLTASIDAKDKSHVIEAGANDVLNKPFNIVQLFSTLSKIKGVEYVYENPIKPSVEKVIVASSKKGEIIPHEILSKMLDAIQEGNMVVIRRCIESISEIDAELAHELSFHAKKYDYDYLMSIIHTIKRGK